MNGSPADSAILRRYRPILELGRGGMATVHLAATEAQAGFNKLVVLKQIRAEFAQDIEFIDQFLDEARLAARLNHPNVVQTQEVGQHEGQPFMVMEYLDGQPFNLARGSHRTSSWMPLELQLRVLCDVLAGLHHAHELCDFDGTPLSVVHRDVSPHNVFVTYDGQVKVVDFGIAKASVTSSETQQGVIKGKLVYMAPEQARGQPLDRRADLFAVGVMLWEALTGRRMWAGIPESGIYYRLTEGDIPSLHEAAPQAPPALAAIVKRALAFDRAERHRSALDMQTEIEQFARSLPAVSTRRLGQFVSEHFATQRARIKEAIETQLGDLRFSGTASRVRHQLSLLEASPESLSGPPSSLSGPLPASLAAPSGSRPADSSSFGPPPSIAVEPAGSAPVEATGRTTPSAAPRSRWMLVALVGGGVGVTAAVGGGLLLRRGAVSQTATAMVTATASVASAPAPSAPSALPGAMALVCPSGMVKVPGGDFYMGHDGDGAMESERPAHPVALDAFCIDVTEVTVAQYRACSDLGRCPRAARDVSWPGATASEKKVYGPLCNIDDPGHDMHPINCVNWEMADNFCRRQGKRLPTSAEWEFAVRGPDGRMYPWGDEPPDANHLNACGKECLDWGKKHGVTDLTAMHQQDDSFPTTAPVGSFPRGRSRYGLDDVIGNVMEWVQDWDGPYSKDASRNPTGPATGTERVVRGGAWNAGHNVWVRPSFRFRMSPDALSHGIGFRCAAALSAPP